MTYFGFLLRFLVIPILVFLVLAYRDSKKDNPIRAFHGGRALWIAIGVHVLLAVAYTTPWDNYLVATGVWYYNPALVTGLVLGYVPIEEYTFFVLETLLAGLWWWFVARRLPPPARAFKPGRPLVTLSAGIMTALWLLCTALFLFGSQSWIYLSIILFWALPPMILQLIFGADILWHHRKLVFWGFFIPGLYLSLIDIVALRETTWTISPHQTTGIRFFGILPIEEVLFFFVTNILLTFGMTLLLANASQARLTEIQNRIQQWRARPAPRDPTF